jgi:hypothetical protein
MFVRNAVRDLSLLGRVRKSHTHIEGCKEEEEEEEEEERRRRSGV